MSLFSLEARERVLEAIHSCCVVKTLWLPGTTVLMLLPHHVETSGAKSWSTASDCKYLHYKRSEVYFHVVFLSISFLQPFHLTPASNHHLVTTCSGSSYLCYKQVQRTGCVLLSKLHKAWGKDAPEHLLLSISLHRNRKHLLEHHPLKQFSEVRHYWKREFLQRMNVTGILLGEERRLLQACLPLREDSHNPGRCFMYPAVLFPMPPAASYTGQDQTPGYVVISTKSFHPSFSRAFLGLQLNILH